MGSYQRITIVLILIVCLVGLSAGRGDGTASRSPTNLVTPEPEIEYITVTVIGTMALSEEESNNGSTPTHQTLSMVTPAPERTDETLATAQNVTPTVVPSKASPAPDSATYIEVVTEVGTGPSAVVGDGTGDEELTMATQATTDGLGVTSDGVDAATLPVAEDLVEEGATEAIEVLTDILSIVTEESEDIITTMDELLTTRQDADILHVPTIIEIELQEITTASETLAPAVASTLGKHSTTQFVSTPEVLTTMDHITSAPQSTPERATTSMPHTSLPPTTPESATTAMLHTSLPPATPERATTLMPNTSLPPTTPESATTAMLHTSLPPATPERATTSMPHTSLPPTTPESATTAMLHTSLPPATPERATTSMLHTSVPTTTTSQASTGSPSTSRVAQTMESDHTDSHQNQISASDLSSDDIDNIVTLKFNGITVNSWYDSYDVAFRQYLSNMLTSVESNDIYYIRPTPLDQNDILYVSFIARSSSEHKRSTKPVVPLDDLLGALDNMTAFTHALGILPSQAPNITTDLPDFIQNTLPTSPSRTLPVNGDDGDDTTEESTRKPPPEIGFLSNPGLFISLVVIATVSIIIIIVGLIYLLCDRKRGRSGEYITNHTPRNSDLELGFDNPVMAENDKNVSNGNHLSSIKGEMESDMIVPYDNFTQEELMNYEVEDTHL